MLALEGLAPEQIDTLLAELDHLEERQRCADDPFYFISRLEAWDEREAAPFKFNVTNPDGPWYWQRQILQEWIDRKQCITLKARQIGVTWLAAAYALWIVLYQPGSAGIIYRQTEEDAVKIVKRVWFMFQSLPKHLRNDCEVIKPDRGAEPSKQIVLRFPSGKTSTLTGMTSTGTGGHGDTAAIAILDEYSRIEKAREVLKAASSVVGRKTLLVISTANGRHNPQTGEGNDFHRLWENAEDANLHRQFLSWRMHPDRDDAWYATSPEIRKLDESDRLEQYPETPSEAFAFSQSLYFNKEALFWYGAQEPPEVVTRGRFKRMLGFTTRARFLKDPAGWISVYRKPQDDVKYLIAADVATGRGLDYSAAYVLNLEAMSLDCEFYGKLGADEYAEQLYWLGKWYHEALIAVEQGGGYGEPVIIQLRSRNDGRPAYPRLYQHRQLSRADHAEHKPWGYPMNSKTRPQALAALAAAIREKTLPFMPPRLLMECGNFVHRDKNPSPAAADGCNDDLVMAAAIALDLYQTYGYHPKRRRPKTRRPQPIYPWQNAA